MSIIKAIENAYKKAEERNWDRIYFAIDVHDTILKSNYQDGSYEFWNDSSRYALHMLSMRKEVRIILWSSASKEEQEKIATFLYRHGCIVDFFNENPEQPNTSYADFSEKFYFSVLLDDKAGFDPDTDWDKIIEFYKYKDNPYVSGRNV
ncbi:MAG TPA: hypothetical protein VFM18_20305 [Methanosarcina sp.]|nr:hypothetical protein [Methanosarcina sp.]